VPTRPYLIDHQLNPFVALALKRADWNVRTVSELFGTSPQQKVPDQAIIPRCAQEGLAWITADIKARHAHRRLLIHHQISVLFVKRPNVGFNSRYELALLSNALRHFDFCLADAEGWVLHCQVGWALPSPVEEITRFARTHTKQSGDS
jgi:hypothetical protein